MMTDLIKRDDALKMLTVHGSIVSRAYAEIEALPAVTVAEPVAHAYIVDGECEQIEWGAEYCLPDDPALTILYTLTPALPAVTVREPTEAQIASACLSYDHSFGLMDGPQRVAMMHQAREWFHAWRKEYVK